MQGAHQWQHRVVIGKEDKKIWLVYCPTEDMVTDALTKALPSPKVKHFTSALVLL